MSEAVWAINGNDPSYYGVVVAGGNFRCGGASSVRLQASSAADAAALFDDGQTVTIHRDSTDFFTGRVREVSRQASGSQEGHDYLVEDVWADLEKTTYQEPWQCAGGSVLLPMCVLGMKPDGALMNVGEQIAAVLAFAAGCGIALQAGAVPAGGMDLWPSEAHSISCAEVIRNSLRLHPDWIPWIDHGTSPVTFNVTARAAATTAAVSMESCTDVSIAKRPDRLPECVRIAYTRSTIVSDGDNEVVSRDLAIDKWPTGGAESGPGVLTLDIELAGGSATIAKQQIETYDIPWDISTDPDAAGVQAAAKAYLKWKFPNLVYVPRDPGPPVVEAKGIEDSHFTVVKFDKKLILDGNPKPAAINPNATRRDLRTPADAPRELVQGPMQEWMRKRSGNITLQLKTFPSHLATRNEIMLLNTLPKDGILPAVVGTNAETKIYKGLPQWKTTGDSIPIGVAHAFYDSIANSCLFEGSLAIIGGSAAAYHGSVLCVSEGEGEWVDMKAPIHSISWDAQTERVSLSFGPNPDLGIPDFLEYLRLLRRRPATWWSPGERASAEIGSTSEPSAHGDYVTGGISP